MEEHEYHHNKKVDKTYVSKPFSNGGERLSPRMLRIASKVIDQSEHQGYVQMKDEVVLYTSPGCREEI